LVLKSGALLSPNQNDRTALPAFRLPLRIVRVVTPYASASACWLGKAENLGFFVTGSLRVKTYADRSSNQQSQANSTFPVAAGRLFRSPVCLPVWQGKNMGLQDGLCEQSQSPAA